MGFCLLSPSPSSQGWACSFHHCSEEKRKQLSPRKGFVGDRCTPPAPQREALCRHTAPGPPGLVDLLVPRLSTVVPPDIPDCCPSFPRAWGDCDRTTSIVKAQVVTVNDPTTSCPSLPAASRALSGQVPLPWGFPQPHRGCPCVPSVTHGAAMLGGVVTSGHGNTGLGILPWSQHGFAGTVWPSVA